MDYNPQGERSVQIWLYFSDPRRKSDVQQLRTNDNIAAKEIERLQGLIEDLKQYRLEMADRAAYLLTAQPVRSAELKRRRDAWSKKSTMILSSGKPSRTAPGSASAARPTTAPTGTRP